MPTPASFYPNIGALVKIQDLPAQLQFLQNGLQNALNKIYYKELQFVKSPDGSQAYYNMVLLTNVVLKLDLFDTGFSIVINPGNSSNETIIPLTLNYNWPVLRLIHNFNLESFSYLSADIQTILNQVLQLSENDMLKAALEAFEGGITHAEISSLVAKINATYNLTGNNAIPVPTESDFNTMAGKLSDAIANNSLIFDDFQTVVRNIYLQNTQANFSENLNLFSLAVTGESIQNYIKRFIIPQIDASLDLSLGLAFPRNILLPLSAPGNSGEPLPEPNQAILVFNAGTLYFSTQGGISFDKEMDVSFNHPVQIGNTGLGLELNKAKLDLSTNTNIPEADLDGRPADFMGVYIEKAAITLPSKWFNDVNNTTLQIAGRNMLIGTGGFSGTIALEAVNSTPITDDDYLTAKIGDNFAIGFRRFDMTFRQNRIVSSNIEGQFTVPKFKGQNGENVKIAISGFFSGDGDFNLTASVAEGIRANLFNSVYFNFLSLELGRTDQVFYIGTSCEISFPEDSVMKRLIGDQKIVLPKVRIYSNGRMELVGGNAFIPTSINLHLGPVNVAVTGITFGSYEGTDKNNQKRKYNYFGFEGAISIKPLGLDVKGEGLKYYYTTDNDEYNGEGDSFLHLKTLSVDLVIPGDAEAGKAMAIIHGALSIPEPGQSQEYTGEISLKLPDLKFAAGASMRLMPKAPAFIIDSFADLPAPIPIGPVGIYGFRSILGYRYVAEKEAVGLVSGQNTWYDYYVCPPRGIHIKKFSGPERTMNFKSPFSIGIGAVIGTSFDNGKIILARVMMMLSIPKLFMIDGRAVLLSGVLKLDDTNEPPFFASLAIGDNAIEIFMGADMQLPQDSGKILALRASVESFFPTKSGQNSWYVHAGTRQKPNTGRLFPELFDLSVKAYLELSSRGFETGVSAQFNFDKKFFGIHVKAFAYIELMGKISFERVQIGGSISMGGSISVNVWKLLYASIELHTILAAEAAKPSKIYAELQVKGAIKVLGLGVLFDLGLKLKWESKIKQYPDKTPLEPLPVSRCAELVKGVHMLTNEAFDLNTFYDSAPAANAITKVIPLDTYIEIRTVKDMALSSTVAEAALLKKQFIDGTAISDGREFIPPQKITRSGFATSQTVHKYVLKSFTVKAWNAQNNQWVDYHPVAALASAENQNSAAQQPIGSWQLENGIHNTIRVLANNPFSYLDAGEPGWDAPEQSGITPGNVLCRPVPPELITVNVLNKVLGTTYAYRGFTPYYINGAYFRLTEEYTGIILSNDITPVNTLIVTNDFWFDKALTFSNLNSLEITLPEDSPYVSLRLSSCAPDVSIKYYACLLDGNSSHPQWQLVTETVVHSYDLYNPVIFEEPDHPIMRIVIEPVFHIEILHQINELKAQIDILRAECELSGTNWSDLYSLQIELNNLYTHFCCSSYYYNYSYYGQFAIQCKTSFQELKYRTVQEYEYITQIPNIMEFEQQQNAIMAAINQTIQVIWRPNTKYYIQFILQDYVDNILRGNYNFYYGFQTSGGVGHYIPGAGETVAVKQERKEKYNSLARYIDYKRSYPNADGNLLQSKPLFWGNEKCIITIFFIRPYVYHILNEWPAYNGLSSWHGAINIKIKDPVTGVLIPYPLPVDEIVDGETVSGTVANGDDGTTWKSSEKNGDLLPVSLRIMNHFILNAPDPCDCFLDEMNPPDKAYSIKLTNLKPLKLYTALVYNALYTGNPAVLNDEQNALVHNFVFQTSMYESFTHQVNSYRLYDEQGNEKEAVFNLPLNLTTAQVNQARAVIFEDEENANIPSELNTLYTHPFDKVMEGIFQTTPLDPAVCTEFNIIRDENGNAVALLIRNPEPFNDPKMPVKDNHNIEGYTDSVEDTILAGNLSEDDSFVPDTAFKTLHSRDYTQAIIMKGEDIADNASLTVQFTYKLWNGKHYQSMEQLAVTFNINL